MESTGLGQVNASGFPLQIGLAHAVDATHRSHGWSVLHAEHGWINPQTQESGFIDLVLQNEHGTVVLNVECKRPQDATWQFLLPARDDGPEARAKFWASYVSSKQASYFGWMDLDLRPVSYQSSFCVVPGQDSRSRPMLERVASQAVASTEALAEEEAAVLRAQDYDQLRTYINVIATTAKLEVCRFDPSEVDLDTGRIAAVDCEEVQYLRFRKQLSPYTQTNDPKALASFHGIAKAKEHTVFVVQANQLVEMLPQFHLDPDIGRRVSRHS